ncbi:hypothetical protein NIIDNTM18_28060 [Mycolicibacterium litorale]|uniref:SnoaL-like domain-containing protein n=1 Tax=Mycolicibacterium litorale TaxID=758802 RepID=A0A6S6PBH5_9MYCO|nr:hypothetical protein NIIDNTM18_28060 [Mycolicibacterium litorale]
MAFPRHDLLTAVERSPRLVAEHDRAGWVALYTPDAVIEDPVGSRPHRGLAEIDRFYATFIAPRDITFHVRRDVVVDETVVRDVDLEVGMTAGVTMRIPAVLRYDLAGVDGELKITRLQAFWELPGMVATFLRRGPRAVPAGGALTVGLLRNQGLGGAAGFLAGLRGRVPPADATSRGSSRTPAQATKWRCGAGWAGAHASPSARTARSAGPNSCAPSATSAATS